MASTLTRTVDIAATPDRVWALVSDLPGMGRFSPENTGGSWVKADAAAVGAVFVGKNAHGRRTWSTRSTVTRCRPGHELAFEVSSVGLPVAEWSYALEPSELGCRLTESWHDRRGRLMNVLGRLVTGVGDRADFTARSIEQTLQAIRAEVEDAAQRDAGHSA